MGRDRLVFYLGDHPVGKFRGRAYPTRAGRVKYDPYRGTGHLVLARALGRGEAVGCWFRRRGERVTLTVVGEKLVLGRPGQRSHWYLDIARLGRAVAAEPGAAADRAGSSWPRGV
jgi:hypothetical protein